VEHLAREIGTALRRIREARGLTLREAADASDGRFKPSSIAGYERGERAITVQRFCDLAQVYGADPARLLDGVVRATRHEPVVEVDLEDLRDAGDPEVASVRSLARGVLDLREEEDDEVVSLRRADLEVLAAASGRAPGELLAILAEVHRRRSRR
jgi:transcriptional regulator with XRE-family HTH domain